MKSAALLLTAKKAGVCGVALAAALAVAPSRGARSRLAEDDLFSEAVEELGRSAVRAGVTELVVAVDVEGELVLSRGFAAARCGEGPDGDTAFHAGPLLSTFLSVAALALAEEERLDLESPLSEHFPDLPYGALGVRVDQLLTHTSGIPGYGDLLRSARRRSPEADRERILAWLRNGPLDSTPGTCAMYSNTNDFLLGLVLERVTGKSVRAHLAQAVFAPAGMEDTGFARAAPPLRSARVEQEFAGSFEDQDGVPGPFGAEELGSTARDLLRFQRALVERRLLPASALALRAAAARLADGTTVDCGRGLALTRAGGLLRHSAGGGMGGQRVQLSYFPELDATIVVWASDEDAPVQQLAARVARALLDVEEPAIRDLPTSPAQRARYVGDYYVGCINHAVADEEEHLVLYPPEGPRTVLLHQGGESFVARDDPDVHLEFESDGAGIVAFVLSEHGVSVRARRMF